MWERWMFHGCLTLLIRGFNFSFLLRMRMNMQSNIVWNLTNNFSLSIIFVLAKKSLTSFLSKMRALNNYWLQIFTLNVFVLNLNHSQYCSRIVKWKKDNNFSSLFRFNQSFFFIFKWWLWSCDWLEYLLRLLLFWWLL